MKKELGSDGFSKNYWEKNYSEPEEMDNISNCKEHAEYLRASFNLEQAEIKSVIDLGFGLGYLFESVVEVFKPIRAVGIEPSEFAFDLTTKRLAKKNLAQKFQLKNIDLVEWCKKISDKDKAFDLGICTSVFQYLTDEEIQFVLPILAKQVRFLYFSVPTDVEYARQIAEYDFFDEYAIHRKKEKYLKWIRPHFTFVSSRLLESKHYFDDDNTVFKEQLFRF